MQIIRPPDSRGALELAKLSPVVSTFLAGFASLLIVFSLGSDVKVSACRFLGMSSKGWGQVLLGIAVILLLLCTELFVNTVGGYSKAYFDWLTRRGYEQDYEDDEEQEAVKTPFILFNAIYSYNIGVIFFFAGAAVLVSANSIPVAVIFGIGGLLELVWFCVNAARKDSKAPRWGKTEISFDPVGSLQLKRKKS